jgi:hypothetical protein
MHKYACSSTYENYLPIRTYLSLLAARQAWIQIEEATLEKRALERKLVSLAARA